ncbi:MAG: hypothetical protein A2W05_05370 [Candidatus Schekmanbacteria bacterium RBG_16_38_10]|uniref:Creatinine amidohydrolase n=1 Tax=Candidatus Schekmanbacteria bacterium RBG_16_38_10 TaxID=1817879 RepID=A0A1F7RZ20_9BACT|nr:MAG: hypothetical protein A2W05_05370 [Candidatus Schekmanbacteria bacterium RBG_16_38_10]
MISSILTHSEMANEIEATHKNGYKAIAYLPVGCIEQHGPFLPLETDSLIANAFAKDICTMMTEKKYWGYVFPPVHYSPTRSNIGFCGSVSIDEEPFRAYVSQICSSLMKHPFDVLVIVSGHGPADPSLKEISFQLVNKQFLNYSKQVIPAVVISIFEHSYKIEKRFKQKPGKHADWREFLMLYRLLGEKYFDGDRLNRLKDFSDSNSFENTPSLILGIPIEYRSTDGVIGDPLPHGDADWETLANEIWEYLLLVTIERLIKEFESFNNRWGVKSITD